MKKIHTEYEGQMFTLESSCTDGNRHLIIESQDEDFFVWYTVGEDISKLGSSELELRVWVSDKVYGNDSDDSCVLLPLNWIIV